MKIKMSSLYEMQLLFSLNCLGHIDVWVFNCKIDIATAKNDFWSLFPPYFLYWALQPSL